MSSGPLESAIESKAVKFAESRGWWNVKLEKCSKRGVPDRLFIRRARVVFIEFKRGGEVPSLQQQIRMAELLAQGVEVHWFDNYEDAAAVLA
jgi:hypothetical protein